MTSKPSNSKSPAAYIERMGFGPAQWKVLLAVGGSKLSDGSELLLLGSVTRAVAGEWNLDTWQRGMIVSVVFFGVLIGNLLSGFMGDKYGRRLPVIISYVGIGVFSLLSMLSTGFWSIVIIRFLVGLSFGISGPACNTLCGEMSPSRDRLKMNAYSMCLFGGGELYSAFLVWTQDPYMQNLNWRWLVGMGALPSFIFLALALWSLHESPSFLMVNDRPDEAQKVLEDMRTSNGATNVEIDLSDAPVGAEPETPRSLMTFTEKLALVLGRHLIYTTMVVCISVFVLNFLFYGGLYALPQVLPQLKLQVSPSANLMIGAMVELPGYFLAVAVGERFTRKNAMLLYLLAALISTLTFSHAGSQLYQSEMGMYNPDLRAFNEMMVQVGLVGNKLFTAVGFLMVYVYATEVYPTVARTTGAALCLAFGRLGAIIAPTVFENLLVMTGSYSAFFNLTASLCAFNAIMVLFLPYETQGSLLQDHLPGQQPLISDKSVGPTGRECAKEP